MPRRPMPPELRLLLGKPLRRKQPARMHPAPLDTRPPDHLRGDALAAWHELAPMLAETGIASCLDRTALTVLCQCIGVTRACQRVLDAEGRFLVDASGNRRAHPALRAYFAFDSEARRWIAEFGMTPATRFRSETD